jgi:CHD5-like protein
MYLLNNVVKGDVNDVIDKGSDVDTPKLDIQMTRIDVIFQSLRKPAMPLQDYLAVSSIPLTHSLFPAMSLLLTVFFIELVSYLILSIGSKPINDLLWQLYCRTPFGTSQDYKDQVRLRREVVNLKRDMSAVSAQDEFTRWAKLRRKHDKALEEHDKKCGIHNSIAEPVLIRYSCCCQGLPILIRCESHCRSLDMYERVAIRSTVLAHQDAHFHVPSRLVSMADRMDTGLSTLFLWRSQHQCLEQLLLDRDSTGWRASPVRLPLHSRDPQQATQDQSRHGGKDQIAAMTKLFPGSSEISILSRQ